MAVLTEANEFINNGTPRCTGKVGAVKTIWAFEAHT